MKFFKKIFVSSLALSVIAASGTGTVVAADRLFEGSKNEACQGASASNSNNCRGNDASGKLESTIKEIINILSIIVGVIAVIMIVFNGFRFVTSGGDSAAVSSARNGILYALVGLIIVALAQIIVRFVLTKIA